MLGTICALSVGILSLTSQPGSHGAMGNELVVTTFAPAADANSGITTPDQTALRNTGADGYARAHGSSTSSFARRAGI